MEVSSEKLHPASHLDGPVCLVLGPHSITQALPACMTLQVPFSLPGYVCPKAVTEVRTQQIGHSEDYVNINTQNTHTLCLAEQRHLSLPVSNLTDTPWASLLAGVQAG